MTREITAGSAAPVRRPQPGPAKPKNSEPETVKILTLNDLLDAQGGVPGIVDIIQKSGADIVNLQESGGNTAAIANAMGFNFLQQGDDTAVLTRFSIDDATPNKAGVTITTDSGKQLEVFNSHLYYRPYQPYQLAHIPYGDDPFFDTEAEAVESANQSRSADVQNVLAEVKAAEDKHLPMVLTGDFNEPSHLDWTQRAADAGLNPIKVEWPATKTFENAGFHDAYRTVFPDEVANKGYTWTPTTAATDPKDKHDRIDFVLFKGDGISVKNVDVVGENAENASIVVTPYVTDHRGVMATFELPA